MSQPPPFNRSADYSQDELNNVGGRSTVRTAALDAELDAVQLVISALRSRLAVLQRADGLLQDGAVTAQALAGDVRALLAASGGAIRGAWGAGTAYRPRDVVTATGRTYLCAVAHTSGTTFAADLAAARWLLLAESVGALSAISVSNTPAGTLSAANVQLALNELDAEKLSVSQNLLDVPDKVLATSNLGALSVFGGTMGGALTLLGETFGANDAAPFSAMQGAISGLTLSRVNATTLGVSLGCAASDPTVGATGLLGGSFIRLFSVLNPFMFHKMWGQLWAPGENAGALDVGSIINGWLHVFLISEDPALGPVMPDILVSQSATAPIMPPGYNTRRRIGSIQIVSGAMVPVTQRGDVFRFDTPSAVRSGFANQGAQLVAVRAPPGIVVEPLLAGYIQASAMQIPAGPTPITLDFASGGAVDWQTVASIGVGNQSDGFTVRGVFTNINGEVHMRPSHQLLTCLVNSIGWIDTRGR